MGPQKRKRELNEALKPTVKDDEKILETNLQELKFSETPLTEDSSDEELVFESDSDEAEDVPVFLNSDEELEEKDDDDDDDNKDDETDEEEEGDDDDDENNGGETDEEEEENSDFEDGKELTAKVEKTENLSNASKNETNDEVSGKIKRKVKPSRNKKAETFANLQSETKNNEYAEDSSDEEDIRNTVGNIPMNWYDEYPHLGYDWEGKKILKPEKSDQLDEFLKRMDDPDFWRTVNDPQTGQKVVLTDEDVQLITRMQTGKVPDASFQEYAPWVEWFTSKVMKTPVRKFPEQKRSFLPSQSEKEKVSKLVHALKMGWIKTEADKRKEREEKKVPKLYMLWKSEEPEHMRRLHNHIPAPKRALPGHAESYNPPPEYLFDKKEMKEWEKHAETPWKRKLHFLPQKYASLREVPAYSRFVQERFQRCLDLYLCPRGRKMRLTLEPEDLVPKLPSPKDLQPFPTIQSIVYSGHSDMVRSISVEGKGQYIVSGSDDMTVKVWEVSTGRCLKTIPCGGVVRSVSWCPNSALSLIVVAADRKVLLINSGVGDSLVVNKTDILLEEAPPEEPVAERISAVVQWQQVELGTVEYNSGIRIILNHFKEVKQVTWHGRGDYFATVMPEAQHRSVLIHQLSRRRSQMPFSKSKGLVQRVLFHPIRPILFVALQRNIRVYDLVKQEMVKKLTSSVRWISSMAVHPGGDNVLVSTYDRKLLWYDLDLSTAPYRTLRLHSSAVRSVAYHSRYPLFASASDDKSVIVSHGMVYSDLLQNPLLVPLKRLSYHDEVNDIGVCDVVFHPTQPWLFSSGADHTIRLYT